MIITKLKLENYGLFAGANEFDLRPRVRYKKTRPIILFGGKNGAGKTTFLDAIRLILYGRRSIAPKISQKDYESALINRVHRNKTSNSRASYAKVALEFEHVIGGEKHLFYVERSWLVGRGDKLTERFLVTKNGQALEALNSRQPEFFVGKEHQEAFIADIVPERLSQLFFFDGEKIKGIADDISSNEAIAEAIQSLLGIDTVITLKSDLTIYRSRILQRANPKEFDQHLKALKDQKEQTQRKINAIDEELDSLGTAIDGAKITISSIESELFQRGGSFAGTREENQKKKKTLDQDISEAETAIRGAFEGTISFALCPQTSTQLLKELDAEESTQELAVASHHLESFESQLIRSIRSNKQLPTWQEFSETIRHEIQKYKEKIARQPGKQPTIHALSTRESQKIRELLTMRLDTDMDLVMRHLDRIEDLYSEQASVAKDLERAPDETDVRELFDRLSKRNQELGQLELSKTKRETEKKSLENTLAALDRDLENAEKKIGVAGRNQEKLDQIAKIGPALDRFKDKLTQAKISALQAEVTECFNRLSRKSDFVKGILVDPKTFHVSMIDEHGRAMPKEDLSSGEKQIFAIAMLWGLARTSGRPLPVVIDTPLGRLDSDHRTKLIENYFPQAGHQVILLSTDTEVDQEQYKRLSPEISHSYHLDYQHDQGKTTYKEEYFWRG